MTIHDLCFLLWKCAFGSVRTYRGEYQETALQLLARYQGDIELLACAAERYEQAYERYFTARNERVGQVFAPFLLAGHAVAEVVLLAEKRNAAFLLYHSSDGYSIHHTMAKKTEETLVVPDETFRAWERFKRAEHALWEVADGLWWLYITAHWERRVCRASAGDHSPYREETHILITPKGTWRVGVAGKKGDPIDTYTRVFLWESGGHAP